MKTLEIVRKLEDKNIDVLGYNDDDKERSDEIVLDNELFIKIEDNQLVLYKDEYHYINGQYSVELLRTNDINQIITKYHKSTGC